ncbi:MAG TPA: endonuclease/exonuclease/phosphatase family protein [Caulobacteraceae bacterium]|jgi:endonuclease/exonuclease/phosphatase family metal-dependent hydrolase|nr:endonuclease/exonuclease/phosphatase family protein [Caulobacteraceae bacterium]
MANILSLPLMLAAVAASPVENIEYPLTPPPVRAESVRPAVAPPAADAKTRELVVLSYNIHGLPWPLTKNPRRTLREIGRELGEMRRQGRAPDVVLIQEGFAPLDDLVRESGYSHWARGPDRHERTASPAAGEGFARARYIATGEGWGKFTGAGLHVLSDFPIMEIESDAYGWCAGWDCLANKGVMMVRLDVPGLPGGLEVVNTHLNSREAAKVPDARSLRAHNLQMEEMEAFIGRVRNPRAPLVVGGDFNVRDAPERYYFNAAARPFTVVSEFCKVSSNGCPSPALDRPEPWLASEDLQAFATDGVVNIRPVEARTIFDGAGIGSRLSDHDGYLVRYALSWR